MISFSDIIGHDSVKSHLQQAIIHEKLSHAYIISGAEGSGKSMLAECFAAALQCTGSKETPCGGCISCMQAESGNHPDIIHVTHEKAKIGVDEIRLQLNNDIGIRPYSGKYKIYIIKDAEKMTEQAQNALLKTLEEPPAYGIIILLTTNTGAFLNTILSRCVMLQLKPLDTALITGYLMEKHQIPDYFAGLCASFSGGSLGKAISYATTEDFLETKENVIRLLKGIDNMSQVEIMNLLSDLNTKKGSIENYLDLISLWYRDILMFKATGSTKHILFSDEQSEIRRLAENKDFESLNRIMAAVSDTRNRLKANVNFDISIELLLLELKGTQ